MTIIRVHSKKRASDAPGAKGEGVCLTSGVPLYALDNPTVMQEFLHVAGVRSHMYSDIYASVCPCVGWNVASLLDPR